MTFLSRVALLALGFVLVLPLSAAEPAPAKSGTDAAAPASSQRRIQLSEWTATTSRRFTLVGDAFTFELPDPAAVEGQDPFDTGPKKRVTLDANAAAAAWAKIQKLEIMKWRGRYDSRDMGQEDLGGTDWMLEYQAGTDTKKVRGSNAFPGMSPLGMPQMGAGGAGRDADSAYTELIAVFESILPQAK